MESERANRNFRVKTVASITTGIVEDNISVYRGNSASYKQRKKVESVLDRVRKGSLIYGLKINNRLLGRSGLSIGISQSLSRRYVYHLTSKNNNEELVERLLRQRECWLNNDGRMIVETNLVWGYVNSSQIGRLKNDVVLSRIPGSSQLTHKGNLYDNLSKYCEEHSIDLNFVPITFYLSRSVPSSLLKITITQFLEFFSYIQEHTNLANVWIMKPTNLNQGRDIFLFQGLQELSALIYNGRKIRQSNKPIVEAVQQAIYNYISGNRSLILQKYIQNPLLIEGYKFDIRVWALIDHNWKFYLFEEGYLRFSSTKYQLDSESIKDHLMHLTNHSVQKHSSRYKSQQSIQSIQVLKAFLKEKGKINEFAKVSQRIRQIVEVAFKACISVKNGKHRCFQIYGFDFMLDRELNVRLIEANSNPAITEDSPLLSKLIPKMIDDAFKLTVDRMFNCKNHKSHHVQRLTSQNGWQLLGSLNQ